MDSEIVSSIIAVLGTLGGGVITAWVMRDSRKFESLQRRVERYSAEIRASQAEEEAGCEGLVVLGAASTPIAAKNMLRDRTEQRKGLRPSIGPAAVKRA